LQFFPCNDKKKKSGNFGWKTNDFWKFQENSKTVEKTEQHLRRRENFLLLGNVTDLNETTVGSVYNFAGFD